MSDQNPTPNSTSTFQDMLLQAAEGDDGAATELVEAYEPEIRRMIRFWLMDSRLRRLIDSVDVAQSVLARFFTSLSAGQLEIDNPRQLVGLLMTMARNRVADHARRETAIKRGGQMKAEHHSDILRELPGAGHTPSEIVASGELVQAIQGYLDEDVRELVEQRLSGREWADLSAEFRSSPEALRKRYTRAIDKAAAKLGLID